MNNIQRQQKFNEIYQALNPQQRLAVDTIEGPVMVNAGPGTGKTQILAVRIGKIFCSKQILIRATYFALLILIMAQWKCAIACLKLLARPPTA